MEQLPAGSRTLQPDRSTGIWGRAKRVVTGPLGAEIEIARICPDCGQVDRHKRTKFTERHGQDRNGHRKCLSQAQQPQAAAGTLAAGAAAAAVPAAPAGGSASAGAAAHAAAAGMLPLQHTPNIVGGSDNFAGALQDDSALMDLELEQHAEDMQAFAGGDGWYDGAEHADWLTAYEEADAVDGCVPGQDLPLPQEVAAQAFQDAQCMYEQLLAGTQSPEDLGPAMGDVLLEALQTGRQPVNLQHVAGDGTATGSSAAGAERFAAELGVEADLTPEQQELLARRMTLQLQQQEAAFQEQLEQQQAAFQQQLDQHQADLGDSDSELEGGMPWWFDAEADIEEEEAHQTAPHQQQQQQAGTEEGQGQQQQQPDLSPSDTGLPYDRSAQGMQFSLQDDGMECEVPHGPDAPASGSVHAFEQLLNLPLWESQGEHAQLLLYQAVFMLIAWKTDYCVRDAAFVALLGMLCTLLLPKGHNLPPSLYIFKQLLQVKDISTIEHHSCDMGCTGWPPTPKKEWEKHKHDHCKKCGGKRFKFVMGRLVPVRRFWFVLPEDSIRELMADPEFVAALRAPKTGPVGSFWSSPEFKRLNRVVGGVLDSPDHGVLELGFDFAEPYIFVKHSTGLMFMRYAGLPNGASSKRKWHKLVMCIEGPNEPAVMDAFLRPLVESLLRLAPPNPQQQPQSTAAGSEQASPTPSSGGINVTPAVRDATGKVTQGPAHTHYAVLGAVHADSPARSKLMYTICSFTAYLSCGFCKLMGTMKAKTVRYLGYAEAVKTTQGVGAGQEYQMGDTAGARGRIMTTQEIKAQAVAAEYYKARGFEPPPGNRFKGHSPLLRFLYWVEPKRLWVVPFCHAFYLGVVKDFLKLVFSKKTRKATGEGQGGDDGPDNPLRVPDSQRQVMRGRIGGMQLHPAFNRKFRSPFTSLASWQIDDCARAMQCFLPMLLRPARSGQRELPLLTPEVSKKAFGHLKRFLAFHVGHVQYDSWPEYMQAARAATNELIAYGVLMEKNCPGASACTFNLHLLACQLMLQCLERGITHELFELWVERLIGDFKQRVKYRTRAEPEKTMVGDDMQRRALQRWRLKYPDVKTWQEHKAGEGLQPDQQVGAAGAVVGAEAQVTEQHWGDVLQERARRVVQHNLADTDLQQLWFDNWQNLGVGVYKEAMLPGCHHVTSTAFTRSRSRDGSFVLVPFTGPHDDGVKHQVARVRFYLKLSLPAAVQLTLPVGQTGVLLFAVCDLLPYMQPFEDEDICGLDSIVLFGRDKGSREQTFQSLDYPVLLSTVHAPLFRQEYQGQDGLTWWAFVPIYFKTGGKRSPV